MANNLLSSGLLGDSPFGDDPFDSMDSMGNLMDVMLVFACGLLLALIANWNVDVTAGQAPQTPSIIQLEGELQEAQEGTDGLTEDFTEVGSVYRDDETGQLYVVM